jgi:hypothetical protein
MYMFPYLHFLIFPPNSLTQKKGKNAICPISGDYEHKIHIVLIINMLRKECVKRGDDGIFVKPETRMQISSVNNEGETAITGLIAGKWVAMGVVKKRSRYHHRDNIRRRWICSNVCRYAR